MPFKSEAQRAKFAQMVKDGKMKQSVFDEWQKETPKNIPKRVGPKKLNSTDAIREHYKKRFGK